MSPAIARKALRILNKPPDEVHGNNEILGLLTDREQEVL